MQVSVCRIHSLRLFLVALSACTLLIQQVLDCCGLTWVFDLPLPSCRTSSLLQGKHLMLFSSVTLTAMGTGKNMPIWRGRMVTSKRLKRYAQSVCIDLFDQIGMVLN